MAKKVWPDEAVAEYVADVQVLPTVIHESSETQVTLVYRTSRSATDVAHEIAQNYGFGINSSEVKQVRIVSRNVIIMRPVVQGK